MNELAQRRSLTANEAKRQQALVDAYDRALVRRAQAVSTLKERGRELAPLLNNNPYFHHEVEQQAHVHYLRE